MMRTISVLLLVLLFFGCGSRKVNKSESIQVIEQQSVKEVKSDLGLSVRDSFVSQFVNKNSRFKADNVKVNVDGSIDIVNPVVEVVEGSGSVVSVRDSIVKDEGVIKLVESASSFNEIHDKNVDKKQYSWWGWLVPLGLLIGISCLIWKRFK